MCMRKYWNFISKITLKTLYFNLKYLPFKQAIKLPVLVSRQVYLRETSGRVVIDGPIRPGLIQLGYGDVGIFDRYRSRTIWQVAGTVVFQGYCNIGHGSKISVHKDGRLIFGENFVIGAESTIVVTEEVRFGRDTMLSWDVLIMDTDFHQIKGPTGKVINEPSPVVIGDKVWIGCRTLILKGTVIPDHCVIGANSTVAGKLEKSNGVYAGSPCTLRRDGITWEG